MEKENDFRGDSWHNLPPTHLIGQKNQIIFPPSKHGWTLGCTVHSRGLVSNILFKQKGPYSNMRSSRRGRDRRYFYNNRCIRPCPPLPPSLSYLSSTRHMIHMPTSSIEAPYRRPSHVTPGAQQSIATPDRLHHVLPSPVLFTHLRAETNRTRINNQGVVRKGSVTTRDTCHPSPRAWSCENPVGSIPAL